ncbi:MAG: hypothetical protein WD029_09490, partial [Microthrixaceae bacterium]
MKLSDLAGQRVVLLGMGTDMQAALEPILAAEPLEVLLVDEAVNVGSQLGGRALAPSGSQSGLHS